MTIPFVDMKQTGQNIHVLREQRGISVKQLQLLMGFGTPKPSTSGSMESPCPRLITSWRSPPSLTFPLMPYWLRVQPDKAHNPLKRGGNVSLLFCFFSRFRSNTPSTFQRK